MPNVKFYYFPVRALGEGPRMLLAYGDQTFDDTQFGTLEVSLAQTIQVGKNDVMISEFMFGQLPVLEIDGKQYNQSIAISRYLGHKYGLAGSNFEEDFEIDEVMDFVDDIRAKASAVHHESDKDLKAKRNEENAKNVYPALLDKLHGIIEKNNGHLALGKLTWADFMFAGMFDYVKKMMQQPDLEKKYPAFKILVDNVVNLPKIKTLIENSPKYDF